MRTPGLLFLAVVTSCDASEPAPPETPVCGTSESCPGIPFPPGTPNVAGSTHWYRIAEWTPSSRAFDLDRRRHGVQGCTTSYKRFDYDDGRDRVFHAFGDLASLCSSADVTQVQYLLRLDDLGFYDDPWVPAAIYPLVATPEGWKVDAAALEDGISLDKPHFRLADGFVRAGTFWSIGPAREKLPLVLARTCYAPTSLDVLVQPRVLELDLSSKPLAGRLGAVVSSTDGQAAVRELVRRKAACPLYGYFAPSLARLDVVAASVEAPNVGVPCDAQSAAFGFEVIPQGPPIGVAPRTVEPISPWDVCLPYELAKEPTCPPTGCKSFGKRPDGRLDATAAQVWPDRNVEPPLPDDPELALACATLAACLPLDDIALWEGSLAAWKSIAEGRAAFAAACASAEDSNGSYQQPEQHAVPLVGSSVRLAALMPIALSSRGDCARIVAARTPWPGLWCGRSGCSQTSPLGFATCLDDEAHFGSGRVRHCGTALAKCSATSPTGCTDRPRTLCPTDALDRCDGDVHLGCNSNAEVTFLDCGRYGGACVETSDGAVCRYPYVACSKPTCVDDVLVLCTRGHDQLVDCKAAGFAGCKEGRCIP